MSNVLNSILFPGGFHLLGEITLFLVYISCCCSNMRIRQVLKSIRAFPMSHRTYDFQFKYGVKSSDSQGIMHRRSVVGSSNRKFQRAGSMQWFTGEHNQWNHLAEVNFIYILSVP